MQHDTVKWIKSSLGVVPKQVRSFLTAKTQRTPSSRLFLCVLCAFAVQSSAETAKLKRDNSLDGTLLLVLGRGGAFWVLGGKGR
jgi:hypothetical protein